MCATKAFYRESLPIYRQHYKECNLATFLVESNLAYTLAIQEKWTDFDTHYAICKQGESTFDENYKNSKSPSPLMLIEEILEEKKIVR